MKKFTDFMTLFNSIQLPVGNYGIPRSSMPQIDSDLVADFMMFLEDNEVDVRFQTVPAHTLSLTQSEVNKQKVWKLMQLFRKKKAINRVFVSKDDYVLDGSHRLIAQLNMDRNYRVKIVRVDLPILKLVILARKFNGVRFRNASDARLDPVQQRAEMSVDRI